MVIGPRRGLARVVVARERARRRDVEMKCIFATVWGDGEVLSRWKTSSDGTDTER